jgi:hypothetical protein
MAIRRLTKEEVNIIIAARRAKVKRARIERLKRLEADMQGRPGQDYVPDQSSELQLAEQIIDAYLGDGEEPSLSELKELLQSFATDPRLVLTVTKRMLAALEDD